MMGWVCARFLDTLGVSVMGRRPDWMGVCFVIVQAKTEPAVRLSYDDDGDYDDDFMDEWMNMKAVGATTYANSGRKRLTETGKLRMAAKRAQEEEEDERVHAWVEGGEEEWESDL
jgi:hypothetical protein